MRGVSSCLLFLLLTACGSAWNDPYPAADHGKNILYSAFTERPKHLDPVQSYSEDEITFTGQIYEPPLQYHYLKRPYTLIAATVEAVPLARYFDAQGRTLAGSTDAAKIAFTDYVITVKPGIRYQPHPAFARTATGEFAYHSLSARQLAEINTLADFARRDTRELTAEDYV
ncbi:MAG: peptide ABC transporter substrate-binding protein, partial [Rhodocyclaceae bacterium]